MTPEQLAALKFILEMLANGIIEVTDFAAYQQETRDRARELLAALD
jgi:hypothetical protein